MRIETEEEKLPGINFCFMSNSELTAVNLQEGNKTTRIKVLNFEQNKLKISDFNYIGNHIEFYSGGKIYSYYLDFKLLSVKVPEIIEREDINLQTIWIADTTSKERKSRLVLQKEELLYLSSWDDHSNSTIFKSMFQPAVLKTQSNELVIRMNTGQTEIFEYLVLVKPELLKEKGIEDKKKAFRTIYTKGSFSHALVSQNFITFFENRKAKRIVLNSGSGVFQFDLDKLNKDLGADMGAQLVWSDGKEIKILWRDRHFNWIRRAIQITKIRLKFKKLGSWLTFFPMEKNFKLSLIDSNQNVAEGLNIIWIARISWAGLIIWCLLILFSFVIIVLFGLSLKKKFARRQVNFI